MAYFKKQWRYVVLHTEISKAFKRKFDASTGKEIEPNYGKDKKVSTGYLMSSYSKSILCGFITISISYHACFFWLLDKFWCTFFEHVKMSIADSLLSCFLDKGIKFQFIVWLAVGRRGEPNSVV